MVTMNISLNKELADFVDKEVKTKKYANRSEFFRDMIRTIYVWNEPLIIEPLDKDDPDYKLIKQREKNAKFVDFETVKKKWLK